MRRGELAALRWEDVDLETGVLRVKRSWDYQEGVIEPKTVAGTRRVPIPASLRRELLEHLMRQGERAGLVFGRSPSRPFDRTPLIGPPLVRVRG